MKIRKIMAILCICGLMLPLAAGCGGKKEQEKKADEAATAGKAGADKMTFAGPAKKAGAQKGTSQYTTKTFAKKGGDQEGDQGKVSTALKKEGGEAETEKGEEIQE
jgi:hypothetical protein